MYTVTVHNRYAELSNDVEDVTEKYGNLVQANSEAAKKLIPVKKRRKQRKAAEDPRIEEARSEVQKSTNRTEIKKHNRNYKPERKIYSECITRLKKKTEREMVGEVENADARSKHGESWKLINNITARKTVK